MMSKALRWSTPFALVSSLASIGLAACGDDSSSGESGAEKDATAGMGGASSDGGEKDASVQTGGVGGTLKDSGLDDANTAPNLFVDPIQGSDLDFCTKSSPCKTLKRAFELVESGETIYLESGTYSNASGEDFTKSVPDGVTIEAVTVGSAVILGDGGGFGLQFAGSGVLRFVRLESFSTCVRATAGALELDNVELDDCYTAVELASSVQAVSNSTDIIGGGNGYSLSDAATLSVTGGSIKNLGPNCASINPIYAIGTSTVVLKAVSVENNFGSVNLREAATAQVDDSTFANNGSDSCGRSTHFDLGESSELTLSNTKITGGPGHAILGTGGQTIVLGGSIAGTEDIAIEVQTGNYAIDGTQLTGQGKVAAGISIGGTASGTIKNVSISNYSSAVVVSDAGYLTMRSSTLTGNKTGILVSFPDSGVVVDLGSATSLGTNVVQGNDLHGLSVQNGQKIVLASGNTWNPLVQGANSAGKMPSGATFTPSSATGNNFSMSFATGSQIKF